MNETKKVRGGRTQQVARAGKHYVAAELNKRGALDILLTDNMPKIDLTACNNDQSRTVHIRVKAKSRGTFQTSITEGKPSSAPKKPLDEKVFWVFVDIGVKDGVPRYWIAPDWWVRNDIYQTYKQYLDRHGGKRARTPDSTHHAIDEKRLKEWEGRWDILAIFD